MNVIAAMLVALAGASVAPAQTVASLKIITGDGQIQCLAEQCTLQFFQPLTVQALNSAGAPVANATITWAVTSGQDTTVGSPTTITDSHGMSTNPVSQQVFSPRGTTVQPYLQSTIVASANTGSPAVTFSETTSLLDQYGEPMVVANGPLVGGNPLPQTLTPANSGSTLPAIQMFVGGQGVASDGVLGVSIELVLPQGQTSPTITCAASSATGDPGTVISGALSSLSPPSNATCTPVIGGSGTGQFYITIGGYDTSTGPLYAGEFGPYTFTAIAGAPAAIKIVQGNNQSAAPAQGLSELIAQVVDASGNAVQNTGVTWTGNPGPALALTQLSTTTDNSGQVYASGGFSGVAAGIVTITVALTSNPAISATFTETALVNIRSLAKISGDGQSAVAGTSFTSPLVVQVNGNSNPLPNYPVQFSATGPVVLPSTTATTNSSGQAQLTVTAGSSTGTATVTASAGGQSQTFTLTITPTGPVASSIVLVSGNNQNAVISNPFAAALVVQVNSTAGPVGNSTVTWSSTGPVTLSNTSTVTNSAGQTQVAATAGSTAGGATVTAAIAGYSFTFTLTVTPTGPSITASSFANAASGQTGFLSPCGLAAITGSGLAPNGAASLFPAPVFGSPPTSVNGITVDFNNYFAPIFSATLVNGQPQLTVQVPCEVTAGTVPVTVNVGGASTSVQVTVMPAAPGIFQIAYSDGTARAVSLRSDGSFVSLTNPARRGEIVRVYVTGLGPTSPYVGTGQVDNPGADLYGDDAQVTGTVAVGLSTVGGATVTSARLGANMIGVFEVAFIVPANAPQGNNIGFSVSVIPAGKTTAITSASSTIPIE